MKQNIHGLTLKELEGLLSNWGFCLFHARQIFSWIYKKRVLSFSRMSDLPLDLRKRLEENFSCGDLQLIKKLTAKDGTEKFLFKLNDGNFIESVRIPAKGRITGCISTQVGCKFGCRFCASGMKGFKRNLTPAEIVKQVLYLSPTHLVFMGIGEPLDNYDNVLRAIRIINTKEGFNLGARRITISTCGIVPGIKRLIEENLQIELSVSLHAADEKTRLKIMPINKLYPLKELLKACKDYIKKTNRQITFEYVLLKGINSDLQSAKNLSKILKDLKLIKVNLIVANPIEEMGRVPPGVQETLRFQDYLRKQHINTILRRPRGRDIQAACGQLRLRYEK
ncbi:MAG: 23S rRNA (adenine(2503)-C(2))-methyltransferase RlmN [Candidatus Omnitrophica bacterium]|nr:23S rRNA (adenine(2503)-C(2))-methyltransferase RlmN [Candidatus Omnitrophota bacterium]